MKTVTLVLPSDELEEESNRVPKKLPYRWIVAIDVHPDNVADGMDMTDPEYLEAALEIAFPYSISAKVHVLLSPDADTIAQEQGYQNAEHRAAKDNLENLLSDARKNL